MPSLGSLLSISALLALCLQLASATPVPPPIGVSLCKSTPPSAPTLPKTGGTIELPPPAAGLTLKHITLGHGVQNYTCASPTAIPVATGAIATLYNIFPLAAAAPHLAALLTPLAAHLPLPPSSPAPPKPLTLRPAGRFAVAGLHYFRADGVPVFDLAGGDLLLAAKLASVPAPPAADKGPDCTGAVPWLLLEDRGGSRGVRFVYRVLTAGGVAPACGAVAEAAPGKTISVAYAAQYWFYG